MLNYKIFVLSWQKLSLGDSLDVELNNLISELSILQMTLPDRPMSVMEIF